MDRKSGYTLEDIRACRPLVMGPAEVLFNRRLSTLLTALLVRTPLSPNQVTFLSFLVILPAIYLLSTGERTSLIAAGLLIQLSFTLDCCDGEMARLRGHSSPFGAWLDGTLDRIAEVMLFVALGLALERQTGDPRAWLYTLVSFSGLAMTHIVTLMTVNAFGKGKLEESRGLGIIGRLAGLLRISPRTMRNFLRSGIDVYLMVFTLGAVFNQLMWIVYYFAVVQNLYWLGILLLVLARRGR
ncbi:MAG: CDP-alcohol phosphatidyltransferase family protein [Acidobacteria bacterium]|nr:CDP-alcohol phosphatidyltransferase family protein [Acidobacteriota bacterium]